MDRPTLDIVAGGILTLLLLLAAISDLRSRRIPNSLVLGCAVLGLVYVLTRSFSLGAFGSWAGGLGLGLAIWLPFYAFGWLGAGDVKLFAAAAAWFGPVGAVRAALLCAVAGGVLSVAYMFWTRTARVTFYRIGTWALVAVTGQLRPPPPASESRHQLPYGVAMAVGIAIAWWLPDLLPLAW